jgi:Organic solute transporter Ostalpha
MMMDDSTRGPLAAPPTSFGDYEEDQQFTSQHHHSRATGTFRAYCSSLFCCGESGGSSSSTASCVTWTTLHLCCNTVMLIGLGVVVVIMGLQWHAFEQQLSDDEAEIAALKEQVASQDQNQQDLNQRVDQEHSLTLYQMAGTFTLLTCLITAFHITQHLSNYNEAVVQRKIIAILWMSPIYSVTSFLSLIFPSSDEYLAVVKDCYEAYTIYTFLSFLIAVLGRGDRDAAVQVLACHADHLRPPAKCLRSFYYPAPETSATAKAHAVLMECQILALQFVFIRPITSLLNFITDTVMENNGMDDEINDGGTYAYFKSPNFYIAMITNISVFFAFNGLLKFYHAVREDLQWCQPFNKFLSVKSIVFLTFWQGLLISIIVNVNYSPDNALPTLAPTRAPVMIPPSWAPPSGASPSLSHISSTRMPTRAPVSMATDHNSTRYLRLLEDPLGPTTTIRDADTVDVARWNQGSTDTGNTANQSNFTKDPTDEEEEPINSHQRAALIQNFLICLEMLFFSLAHWCVFPAEEWKPDYRPPDHYAKPGMALSDFAKDISYIVRSSARRAAYHKHSNLQPSQNDALSAASSENHRTTEEEDSEEGYEDTGAIPSHNDDLDDGIVDVQFADANGVDEEEDDEDGAVHHRRGTLT